MLAQGQPSYQIPDPRKGEPQAKLCYTSPVNEATILGVGRAAGKVILFGEHAVVYGRPALAVPVTQVWAEAVVEQAIPGAGLTVYAADLDEEIVLRSAPADHPLAAAVRLALAEVGGLRTGAGDQESGVRSQAPEVGGQEAFGLQPPTANLQPLTSNLPPEPDWRITIRSTIPVASGLGSGAAVSAAIVRAVVAATSDRRQSTVNGQPLALPVATISALVYEVERLHHGTPSGIDNTVIAYEQPVYFVRGRPPEPFAIGRPFTLVIADTGIRSPTRLAVGDVRASWQAEPARFEALFDAVAAIVEAARIAIAAGEPEKLGPLMDENHALLREIGVSCPELDALVAAARSAGAVGAKLSGAGRGGNMIALVTTFTAETVADALRAAGATRVIVTEVTTR